MTNFVRFTSIVSAVFSLACFSIPAHAFTEGGLQTSGDRPSGHLAGACRDDAKKLCGDVKPGGDIHDCLKQHEADLSQVCKDNIAEDKKKRQEKMDELKAACQQDLKQYCANVTPGQGREIACLRAYSDKLSAACKEKMPKRGMGKNIHHDKKADTPPPPGQ
jgi:hypothetical protein